MTTSAERLEELRRRALAADVEPISDPAELAKAEHPCALGGHRGHSPPGTTRRAYRLHGPGVPGHDIPVREAAGILTALQETVASIGQVLNPLDHR